MGSGPSTVPSFGHESCVNPANNVNAAQRAVRNDMSGWMMHGAACMVSTRHNVK